MSWWRYDVGEIFLSNDSQCFWMFPTSFFVDKRICMASPWFSHKGERWQIVTTAGPSVSSRGTDVSLYLWKKVRSSHLSHEYTFEAFIKTTDDDEQILSSCSGKINSDFGYSCLQFGHTRDPEKFSVSCHGLMKIFFEIHKGEAILYTSPGTATIVDDDDSRKRDEEIDNSYEPSPKRFQKLAENLKQLLLDGRMSDAVLKVEGREFSVHKVILVARCPVFASMFEHDLIEKTSNVVDIPDCTAESFEIFLHYLYSANVSSMSRSNVHNVYYAADKYRVDELKEECVEFMIANISVETFCDVFALSLRHEESNLQQVATHFFGQNIKKIIKTEQWQKFMDENSTEANELLIKVFNT